jgi:GT2 family glycosyltransferase
VPYRLQAIWHPRQGRAAARNAGIRVAGGNLLVLLDDDMEPVPGLLHAHLDAHQGADECVVLGPVLIVLDSSSSLSPITSPGFGKECTRSLPDPTTGSD